MRVAILAESYLPYLSGVTVSADALARGLGARGHEVLVVAPRPRVGPPAGAGSPGPEPRYAWLPSYQLPLVAPAGYRMPWPAPMASALRTAAAFAPNVVHAQSPFVTGLMARRLARRAGAPLVFTHHTRFAQYRHYLGPLAGPGGVLTDAYLRRFWAGCAAILAPSSDLAGEIEARLPPRGRRPIVRVVPTGVDVAGIRSLPRVDVRAAAGWEAEAVVAVTLGRLAREKSVDVVLDAVAVAAASIARLRLLVVGGGPAEVELRARASDPDLTGRVTFTGALPRPAALAYVKGGDLFTFASRTETQGLVLAEALACGLPVVALDAPGVRDTVRDEVDGLVISASPTGERAALAAGIVRVAGAATALEAFAEAAWRDADRFDLGTRIAEVEAVYEEARARSLG